MPATLPPAISGAAHIIFTAGCRSGRPVSEAQIRRTEYEGVQHTLTAATRVGFGGRLLVKAFADARERDVVQLSNDRARAVVSWLVARGIAVRRLVARGCGASRALWVGDTEPERVPNRRAELARTSRLEDCAPPATFDGN